MSEATLLQSHAPEARYVAMQWYDVVQLKDELEY